MERKNNWKGWLYLAPALILLGIFTLYPLLNTIAISFMKNYDYRSGSFDGLTFSNYGIVLGITEVVPGIEVSKYTQFIQYALPNTLILTAITVPISVVLALLIAIGINSIKFMKKFLQTVFFLPYVTNVIAVGMVFSLMFTTGGLINKLFNLTTNWVLVGANRFNSMFVLCLYMKNQNGIINFTMMGAIGDILQSGRVFGKLQFLYSLHRFYIFQSLRSLELSRNITL